MIRRRRCCRAPVMKGGFVLCVLPWDVDWAYTHTRRLRRLLQLLPSPDQQPRNTQSDKLGGKQTTYMMTSEKPSSSSRPSSFINTDSWLPLAPAEPVLSYNTRKKRTGERERELCARGFSLDRWKELSSLQHTIGRKDFFLTYYISTNSKNRQKK